MEMLTPVRKIYLRLNVPSLDNCDVLELSLWGGQHTFVISEMLFFPFLSGRGLPI